jgi:hypothetical protein
MEPRITVITLGVDDLERALNSIGMDSVCRLGASSARSSNMALLHFSISNTA